MVSRRGFLTGLALTPIAYAAGCSFRPTAPTAAPAATRPLPIPPLAPATVGADGVRRFTLAAQAGSTEIVRGVRTPTWGYSGSVLGPTLRARRGERVAVTVTNELPEPTSVHWHGMHVPAACDGGPHQMVAPGAVWSPSWTVSQQAATLWYHPHPHGATEKHVQRGMAGFFLLDDDPADALDLPKDYGVDDIPLVIQDRRFTADGAIDESDPTDVGLLGDTIVTNGIAGAHLGVTTERVRLRILNGSSGRLYHLAFGDGRHFQLIATDGGLLPEPVELSRIQLSPGERAEIVVTVRAGENVTLRSLPIDERGGIDRAAEFGFDDTFDILDLRAGATLRPAAAVPAALVPITPLAAANTAPARAFELQWFMINNRRMDMNRIDMTIPVDTTEVWSVRNKDNWPHNFHVHDVQFQILAIDGSPPPPALSGWKDTVYTTPGATYILAMHFADHTDPTFPYMYHCHLLHHEDQGMMGQFLVLAPGQRPAPMRMSMGHG
ncbi:copper oxidase [Nocardia asteroides NBRC 15531]|uniref:Multicopper oxidase CueO n=1 Tax=Nocardia asteroides NBRC 15531 TaxID=1110697 RepID=U5EMN9_NOCAS|nr:multicopper oxidase domain-containing protein [Nocardia asteroides]TLF67112.1 copper oxidase [Nocardia asteroides NBRC 15531]UGT51615.1 multicopper oxidase domain-containing protein [Nocardia asteroides]SFM21492.1 Multicopper oxidase with three cupredoxin domains (includes cell division protein FtsP and spore coat protein CotA) [Nocardia asteroides]VEG35486.1 Multicopper oxidase mco [Nocardia asteroides]GAD86354.1 putative multicopper oxidase [Nocardia asteroides NBRC 15531]